jgi:hypothetical protein
MKRKVRCGSPSGSCAVATPKRDTRKPGQKARGQSGQICQAFHRFSPHGGLRLRGRAGDPASFRSTLRITFSAVGRRLRASDLLTCSCREAGAVGAVGSGTALDDEGWALALPLDNQWRGRRLSLADGGRWFASWCAAVSQREREATARSTGTAAW